MLDLKTLLPVLLVAAGVIGTFAVSQYRIDAVEEDVKSFRGEPLRLSLLERDVKLVRCEVRNVRRLLKSQPETDCD